MDRASIIALAVAMGTPKETAEQNYDAAYLPAPPPGPNEIVGGGIERRGDQEWQVAIYGDSRREEILL